MDNSLSDQVHMKDNHYVDEGYCHDNDLILAAELGKALLERNRYLEDALEKARNVEEERKSEIKFLQGQVNDLRKFSTERAHSMDEAERYYQDMECKNYQLLQEKMVDKERISRLSARVKQLEEQLRQLSDETSDDGQQPQSNQQQQSSGPEPARTRSRDDRPSSRTLPRGSRRHQRDVRSGFIDDEFSDQPELLGVETPTASRQHLDHLGPGGRQSRTVVFDGTGGFSCQAREPRFSSHPPNASRCYRPFEADDVLRPDVFCDSAGALSEPASSFCPHGLRSDSLACLVCFEASREVKELKALMHGAAVMRELDRIYDAQLQSQLKALRAGDQQPGYRQLFAEAFQMLRDMRKHAEQ